MAKALPIYLVSLKVPDGTVEHFERALEGLGGALDVGGPDERGLVPLQLYLGEDPGRAAVMARLLPAALMAGVEVPDFTLELMPEIDWVAESRASLPALKAGRFWVYGSHIEEKPPAGSIGLLIDANLAFGTGRHETTRGCLLALTELAKDRRCRPKRALDLGCGSGILAFGAARLWPKLRVLGCDLDEPSVRVAEENARLNRVNDRVRLVQSRGYRARAVGEAAPYDLILANILAGPLCDMATETARHLAPGGSVVLSGLIRRQERQVLARHRAVGLRLERRWRIGNWSTLLLRNHG